MCKVSCCLKTELSSLNLKAWTSFRLWYLFSFRPWEVYFITKYNMQFSLCIQLFRERLSGKVHATILKGIVGGFEFSFFFKESWKNWYERLCKCVCECQRKATKVGSTATVVRNLVLIISHITFRDCRVLIFSDNLSRNSCIPNQNFQRPTTLLWSFCEKRCNMKRNIA